MKGGERKGAEVERCITRPSCQAGHVPKLERMEHAVCDMRCFVPGLATVAVADVIT